MRTPIISLASLLAITACSSGTRTIIVREPAPAPTPAPQYVDPLEITIGRPVRGRLLVQTNRPAYVAVFEIVPDRGVTLVYPSSLRQRQHVMSGMNWVPVWWPAQRAAYYRGASSHGSQPDRFIYAVASDEPLRIPDAAFQEGYLLQVLGPRAYRASYPYATMRALSRHFVTAVMDEEWAEDAFSLGLTYASEPERVVRVYCPGGRVYEVSVEMADRVWCPVGPRVHDDPSVRRPPVRPDSVLGETGRRMPAPPRRRGAIDRVVEGTVGANGNGRGPVDDRDGVGNQGNGRGQGRPEDVGPRGRGPETPRRDSVGNAGNGNAGNGNAGNGNAGNGNAGNPAAGRDTAARENPGRGVIGRTLGRTRIVGSDNGRGTGGGNPAAGNPGRGNENGRGNAGPDPRGAPRAETQPGPQSDPKAGKPDDRTERSQKPEPAPVTADDRPAKPEKADDTGKPEPRAEPAHGKPADESHDNGRAAKQDDPRPEPAAEPTAESRQEKADKPEAKDGKANGKGAGKGAESSKSHGKPDSSDEQKEERKGKP